MQEFKTTRGLGEYIRDKMDLYLGKELPKEFKIEFMELCNDKQTKKKIFSGSDFSKTFKIVLREGRLELLKEILKDEGFYN